MPIYKGVNKKFFEKWSGDMAYVLGFFLADGNITKTRRGTHFLSFDSVDKKLIASIKNVLKSEHKISRRFSLNSGWYRLQIGSVEMFEDLLALGVTQGKSNRLRLPVIPHRYIRDFIRGYFDGDGNVWTGQRNMKMKQTNIIMQASFTSASHDFLSHFQTLLKQQGIKGGSLFRLKNKNCSRLTLSTLDALKLYKIMYNEPHKLYLARKKLVFEKFVKMRL